MNVTIIKHTGIKEARRAIEATMEKGFVSHANLDQIYTWMHSPIRTQIFEIILEDIYAFVSTHLVRHVTTVPFVTSKRDDRGGDKTENRYTPVDTTLWCNAESIINIAQKRLCYQASPETREVIQAVKNTLRGIDPDLSRHMVPQCAFRGGYCCEPRPCGNYKVKRYDPDKIMKMISMEEQ